MTETRKGQATPGPADGAAHRDAGHLAEMANDIGNFFRGQSLREDAVAGIANHIASYWTRRMRDKLIAHLDSGEVELDDLPREAIRRLATQPPQNKHPPGGDAG